MTDGTPSFYNHSVNYPQENYRLIRDAYRSLGRKKFQEAILLLENALSSGAGDIYVLLLLSVGYLHADQFGKLARCITKMKEKDRSYLPLIQLEAFLKLKSAASRDEALGVYIDLAARYPADPHLHRARGLVGDADDFSTFQKAARLQDFVSVPRPPQGMKKAGRKKVDAGIPDRRGVASRHGSIRRRPLFTVMIISAALALGVAGAWFLARGVFLDGAQARRHGTRPDFGSVDLVSLSGTEYDLVKNVPAGRVAVHYRSVRDVTSDFDRARRLIKSGKYNEAVFILNGLYNSNVNFVVKEKVDFLIKFVTDIDDRDFDPVPYSKVAESKFRYRGYAVRWQGTIGRIRERTNSRIILLKVEAPGGGESGEADVFTDRNPVGMDKNSRVVIEGVIVDFPGKEQRVYVAARSMRLLK
ncbi:MAG: hypothetical protein JXA07_15655 [Spirochaetes bacterium]|nr:hypothetical protein [Spirochaetota bacterium]